MRSWTYSYKTSDGLRHEGELEAASKDEAYSELRKRGIRAIRVSERITPVVRRGFKGLRKRDWSLVAAGLVIVAAASALLSWRDESVARNGEARGDSSGGVAGGAEYVALVSAVDKTLAGFWEEFAAIDHDLLTNYRLVRQTTDAKEFFDEIEKGRKVVADGREAVKGVFSRLYETIPADHAQERESARTLYGETMGEIDLASDAIDGAECAIDLLLRHKGEWTVVRGEVKWNNPKAEREFSVFKRSGRTAAFPRERKLEIPH